jgi:CheY-like chemotaxis protein
MSRSCVLIVDDEPYVTAIVGQKLRQTGFDVIVADNGEEAYQIACTERLNIIVTDYQMPILSGFELAVKLRTNPGTADIPVLMLTARGHQLSPRDRLRTNIQFLLPKPFSAKELARKVEELALSENAALDPVGRENHAI